MYDVNKNRTGELVKTGKVEKEVDAGGKEHYNHGHETGFKEAFLDFRTRFLFPYTVLSFKKDGRMFD